MEPVSTCTMYTCPQCQQTRYQVKDGVTGAGSQRVRCRACGRRYTANPKPIGCANDLRSQALKMYVDGLNFRRIARLLGVHHQSVINWLNAAAARLPDTLPAPNDAEPVELDELYTFVAHKKSGATS